MITAERKAELIAKGYEIEDLGATYGPKFKGAYRWINDTDFQDGCESYAEADAWAEADKHEKESA